jgi:hypothetical protein
MDENLIEGEYGTLQLSLYSGTSQQLDIDVTA